MLVELTSRLGGPIAEWLGRPFAFALWTYRHLQEIDRRQGWVKRMHRIEGATLGALAFHEPKKLADEHRVAMTEAGADTDSLLEIGRKMAREMDESGVLE